MDVSAWLRDLGLERYAQAFEAHDVDARTLRSLTSSDLVEIGVASVGHRRKLLEAITALRDAEPTEAAVMPGSASLPAERRQLSVFYCDLRIAEFRLYPEDMREAARIFHDACAAVVAEYGGHVANFYGDRLLAYFGWPRAHEDDVERAVRAGLALMRRIPQLNVSGHLLSARASVATGEVVVGDLIHEGPAQEQSAVGLTPNLGARLLSIAAPGQVVIDELTRQLLPPNFTLLPLGWHTLKGLSEPVAAYGVALEQWIDSRFDARRNRDLSPMIGRDHELNLLLDRWRQVQGGEGQAVLLVGEAGIGKSRLARALLDACSSQPHMAVRWQCSPHHTGNALWPVSQRLSRAAGLDAQDSNEQALDKLEAVSGAAAAALYTRLLGLNGSLRYGPLEMTPQLLRERTLELLLEQLLEMAEERPLLLVVEDAHWIDPSTWELIRRCLERVDNVRMLILITSRPDNQPQPGAHTSVTRLSLNRLGRASVHGIVTHLGGSALTLQTLEAIVARTDGVPLFVEELTKAVLESSEATIPASLHGSLMARLDRMPEVKEVAQIAACIGREFDPALVRTMAERPEAVSAALDKLAAAELVFRHSDRNHPRYIFKHALVQEAAYQSLLKAKRQQLHGRICDALQAAGDAHAEVLARHAHGADRVAQAIEWWQQAGDTAAGKSAYLEAAGYFGQAIELVDACPDRKDRRLQELALLTRLGQANAAGRGAGAIETGNAFDRAYQLLDPKQDVAFRIPVLYGIWAGHLLVRCTQALKVARELLAAVQEDGDAAQHMLAHRLLGASLLSVGDFDGARVHLERSVALIESAPSHVLAMTSQTVADPGVSAYCTLAWALGMQGFADRGMQALQRARTRSSVASSNISRAYLHYYCAIMEMCLDNVPGVVSDATALAEVAAKHELPIYQGGAACLFGWLALQQRRPDEAVAKYDEGLARMGSGTRSMALFFLAGRVVALAACNRADEARHAIEQAIVDSDRTGQRWYTAELLRVRGEVALKGPNPDHAYAAESFVGAIALAREQQARLWEMRATVSLARLRIAQGRDAEALNLLAPVYDAFAERVDTVVLLEARELLGTLGHRVAGPDSLLADARATPVAPSDK